MHEPTWQPLSCPERPRVVALAVGGLNTRSPVVFADLAKALRERDVAVWALELSGHRTDPATERARPGELAEEADFDRWTGEVRDAARVLSERYPGVPRLGLGYSMGGAAMLHAQVVEPLFEGLMLLAPAVAMRPLARALNWLNHSVASLFGLERWAWRPSAVPSRIRANDHVPSIALWTGEQAQRTFANLAREALSALDGRVTVAMREGDGLLSASRIRSFFEDNALQVDWVTVPPASDTAGAAAAWNHEVFDRATLGDSWELVLAALDARLQTIRCTVESRDATGR